MTLNQLYQAAVIADRKFTEALMREYGEQAASMRYSPRQHTRTIRQLALARHQAIEAYRTALRADCQRQHLISLGSDREEQVSHAAAA